MWGWCVNCEWEYCPHKGKVKKESFWGTFLCNWEPQGFRTTWARPLPICSRSAVQIHCNSQPTDSCICPFPHTYWYGVIIKYHRQYYYYYFQFNFITTIFSISITTSQFLFNQLIRSSFLHLLQFHGHLDWIKALFFFWLHVFPTTVMAVRILSHLSKTDRENQISSDTEAAELQTYWKTHLTESVSQTDMDRHPDIWRRRRHHLCCQQWRYSDRYSEQS